MTKAKPTDRQFKMLRHCFNFSFPSEGTIIGGIPVKNAECNAAVKLFVKLKYLDNKEKLTDLGKKTLRDRAGIAEPSLEEARLMHDSVLRTMDDLPIVKKVLDGRTKAASQLRYVLACMYQKDDIASFSQWHIIPCLTSEGTIGVVNIAYGTAFDSGQLACEEVFDLGVQDEVYAAANGCSGTVSLDGEVVQKDGTAVRDGKIIHPNMPEGWRQIALTTWRGYGDTSATFRVPQSLFEKNPIKPTMVCYGLMTCYGKPGLPKQCLNDYYQSDVSKFSWLSNKHENLDPSWWVMSSEKFSKCQELAYNWFDEAERSLLENLSEEEKLITPHRYPNQKFTYWSKNFSEIENQEGAIADNRGTIAGDVTYQFLKMNNVFFLGALEIDGHCWKDGNVINNRRALILCGKLAVIVDHRLKPVCESLRWMLSFPDPDRHYNLGPNKSSYEAACKAAAKSICESVCRFESVHEVIKKMAAIQVSDGPVYHV